MTNRIIINRISTREDLNMLSKDNETRMVNSLLRIILITILISNIVYYIFDYNYN